MIVTGSNRVACCATPAAREAFPLLLTSLFGKLRRAAAAALAVAIMVTATSAMAAIGVNKTFNPTNVSAGQISTLTVILLNNNALPATAAAFADNLPGSVVVATLPNITSSCGGTVTAVPGANNFSLSGGTIPAVVGGVAGQCTVTVDVLSPAAGVFINTIPVGAATSSQGANSQNANATLTVAALLPVTGVKGFAPGNLHGGGGVSTVTMTLSNPNGLTLTGATVTDNLPAGLAVAPTPNASTTCGAGTVSTGATSATLSNGTIPAGGSCIVRFDVVASNPNVFVDVNVNNAIPVNALTTSQGISNTAFNANVRLQTGARVEKAFAPTSITTGGTSTMTLTVRNFNATPLTGIAFTDLLPGTMRVAAPVVTATTCTGLTFTPVPLAGDAAFTVSGGSLPAAPAGVDNANCTVTINVTATNAGVDPATLTNTIPVGNFDGVAFSTAGANLVVNAFTSVSGSKSFAPGTVLQGGTSTLTIRLNNEALVPATITAFTDNLTTLGANPQFIVAAAPPATTTCGGVVNAAPGTTAITLGAGNAIPASGFCTITVPVQVAANATTGTRTNTIAQGALQTSQGRTQTAITANLVVNPVLSVAKSFAPTIVAAGADTRLTITLTRVAGAVPLTGIAFTDTLPAGHLVSATPNVVSSCGGTVTAVAGTGTSVALTGGALAGGAAATTCQILVNITTPSGTAATATNTIAAGSVTSTEGFVNPAAATANIQRVLTNVTLNKSFSPATVLVGGVSQLTINVLNTNAGAIALTNAALTDTLPLGMIVATPPAASNTCGGTLTAVAGSGTVALTSGVIAANATCRIQVNVVANAAGNLTNPLAAGAFSSAQGVSNPLPAAATLSATGVADLAITKTDGVLTVTPGTNTTYTIVASNLGPDAVAGAGVVDTPPAGVTFTGWTCVASPGSGCGTPSGSGPINELVSLLVGGTATYTVTAAIAPGATGTITNTATIVTPPTVVDPNPANNTASDTDTLVPITSIAITKDDGSTTYLPGGTATYVMVLTNGGPSDATNVALTDTLPGGVTQNGPASCVASGAGALCGTITDLGTGFSVAGAYVPVGGGANLAYSLPVSFSAALLAPTITNTVNANNLASTGPGSTASASDTNAILLFAPGLAKSIAPSPIAAGGTTTLTITLSNPNAAGIALTSTFIDNMPPGVTTVGGQLGTCSSVTVTPTSVSKSLGSTIAPGACTIVVQLTSSTPGTVTNTTGQLQTTVGFAGPVSAPLTVTALAPTLTKTIAPASIGIGGTAVLTLNIGNANAVPTTLTLPFTDPMPSGVTTVGGNTGSCVGVIVAPGLITLPSGSTIPNGGCSIIVNVTSSTVGTVTNTTGSVTTGFGVAPPANAPLTVTATAPTLTKTILPATIASGGTATLTLTLGNTNTIPVALTADFTDPMPPGVTTTSVNTGSCVGAVVTPTLITFPTGASIQAGGCTIIVTVTSSTPGAVLNTTSSLQTGFGVAPPATAPLTVTTVLPALAKTIAPATIVSGGSAVLTITIGNINATPLPLTAPFTDAMPLGVTITAGNSGTCPGVTNTPTLITMANGTPIPPGGCTIVVTITSTTPGTVTNTTSPLVIAAGTTPPATAPLTVTEAALTLAKVIAPATIVSGAPATLTITISNSNATPAALTAPFTDPMPPGVTITAGNTGTCPGVTNTPTLITMASGSAVPPGACTIIVTITSTTPGTVTNTTSAVVTAGGSTPPASAPLTVTASASALGKTILPSTIVAGGTSILTLSLSNGNATPQTLTAAFTDPMPAGVTITIGNSGTCPGVTNTPTLITMASGSAIPPGGCTIIVTITSATPGTVTNTTSALTTGAGVTPPASAPLTVTASASALTKTITPATIVAGGTSTLTLALANANATPQTLTAAFTDPMPAGVTITIGNSGTCPGVTNTPTLVTMASGAAIPPGGCTIIVTITSATPGTVTNTTSALTTGAGVTPPASAPLTVTAATGLLTKSISPGTIVAGGTTTMVITLGNSNTTAVTLAAPFTDAMPPGLAINGLNTGSCVGVTVASALITMPIGATIPPGGCTIVVTLTSITPGSVTNVTSALITSAGATPPATATLVVLAVGPPTEIPVNNPAALALMVLLLAGAAAWQFRRRR